MLVYNKYLKELGLKKSDFVDKKDPRYELDKEYGVVEAQTWNLYETIVLELYVYLRDFQDRFMRVSTPIQFVEKYEDGEIKHIEGGEKDWHKIVQQIVDGLKAYITAESMIAMNEEAEAERRKLYEQFEEAWKLLGDNLRHFWW